MRNRAFLLASVDIAVLGDLPPKEWTGLGRHTLSESWADVAQGRMQAKSSPTACAEWIIGLAAGGSSRVNPGRPADFISRNAIVEPHARFSPESDKIAFPESP
jgi:hypothetical protein